ncbi:hypothetical protein F1643_18865 [Azospirillum sp. INR13]|uniref:hypothetical protein n=1 Tax=Azospirillum sp. INR13 TaxID=2596919 RepID=UPI00189243DE|nr:hypothetical protein [Azospirillum sp. INR13]MBF5096129.1 hypothetical protein [Azospirillum sp. INR13]
MMDEAKFDKQKYIKIIQEKGAPKSCPLCGSNDWMTVTRNDESTGTMLPTQGIGSYIETITIGCRNCGFLSQHATKILDGEINGGQG